MASNLKEPEFLPRDGTSQKGRALASLEPANVRVDERTIQDLVAFAREYGKGLTYYGEDDLPAGDWGEFIGSLDPERVAAFLETPKNFDPTTSPALFRPHFVLFLAFLKLFQKAQEEMNALTGRHLDFYYRDVLRMGTKGPVPDQVHLLFDLARGEREVLVPEGSLVTAGPDSLGREQIYRTEEKIIVNRIKIAKKSAVFVERRRIGFPEARAELLDKPQAAFLEMLKLVLGDPLPRYPDKTEMTVGKLNNLARRTREDEGFYLSVSELDDLMRLNALSAADHPDKQAKIDEILNRSSERQIALSMSPVKPSLDEIEIYWTNLDAYFRMLPERFHELMRLLEQPDEHAWKQVDTILDAAYQRKVREDRMRRFRKIHDAQADAGLEPLIRKALGNDSATEYDLTSFLKSDQLDTLEQAKEKQDWESIYSLLEIAERNRLGEQPAQKEEWSKLHPAEDVATAGARPTPEGQEGSPRWATFGLPISPAPGVTPSPVLGWAISSPLLWLREGTRIIKLTLGVSGADIDKEKLGELFVFQVSTAKGWVDCSSIVTNVGSYAKLSRTKAQDDLKGIQFTLTFEETVDPIAPLSSKFAEIEGPGPVLRLMLRPGSNESEQQSIYQKLASLLLLAVHLKVDVDKLRPERLQNDERVLDPKKPFEPFGVAPATGSRLLIGHPEVSGKRLDSLDLQFQWMGAPADLATHYANYHLEEKDPLLVDSAKLTARLSMIDRGKGATLTESVKLFDDSSPISVTPIADDAPKAAPEMLSAVSLSPDVSTWERYLQLELNGSDFGHPVYPALASSKAVKLATAIANKKTEDLDPSKYSINPPYTPKLKSLTLHYTSSQELRLDAGVLDALTARVLHIHPFGYCDIHKDLGSNPLSSGVPLLPRYENDGELYLGLEGVVPSQSVSLLFQLAEGSSNPDLPPQPVEWSYLDGDRWIPFAHRLLQDTTGGLISSGIVRLALDPVAPSTLLGGDLYWIRAAVARNTEAVCDTIDIHPQAVLAVFVDNDNAPDHFSTPLPAGSIKKLRARIPGIAGVRQPYTSRGGRMAEDAGMWATRVSERLRHKERALSMWDYERLVLERYPQIYKARCLPARPENPGRVEIIVIPDIRDLLPSDPFEPKAPSSLLADIKSHLQSKVPCFTEVVVRNPRYVYVRVRLAVRFREEGNDDFYKRKLNDELNRFLSPWAFEEGSDIVLGGRIYANSIVDFVDRRDYVDYVAGVKLFRSTDGEEYSLARDEREGEGYFVAADQADAVLVAARTHEIVVLRDAFYDETSMSGINFMKVELDFIVS